MVEKRQHMHSIRRPTMTRRTLIEILSQQIAQIQRPHPVRVAIDGIDNAGKTTLADELGQELRKIDRHVIRTSIDCFHRPRHERYRRGTLSPKGYFNDSFDLDVLKDNLLKPLGPAGDLHYVETSFDFHKDIPVERVIKNAETNAILLFDGVFLLRSELNAFWDFSIFLHVSFKTALNRALKRDGKLFGNAQETAKRYRQRYIPGQKLYLKAVNPQQLADIIVDNNDPENPMIHKGMDTYF
jgi:uridine kinase